MCQSPGGVSYQRSLTAAAKSRHAPRVKRLPHGYMYIVCMHNIRLQTAVAFKGACAWQNADAQAAPRIILWQEGPGC